MDIKSVDLIVLVSEKNLTLLHVVTSLLYKNIKPRKVFVLANRRIKEKIEKIPGVGFIDEDQVYKGLTLEHVRKILMSISGNCDKGGWYFQQFLKMAWSYRSVNENYIVWDSDTLPLNEIIYEGSDGRLLFTEKREYHKPYFDTIENLFGGKVRKAINGSFVAENMIIHCAIMKKMINDIEGVKESKGELWYEKILYAIKPEFIGHSGFSEFETYGNYVMTYYPDMYSLRKLRSLREAAQILGICPNTDQLLWAAKSYDVISLEGDHQPNGILYKLTRFKIVRTIFSMYKLATFRTRIRSIYRIITGKKDLHFE